MAEFSGAIGVPSSGFTLRVVYSWTQNIAGNSSTVTATGYVKRNNSSYRPYNSTSTIQLTINGNTKTLSSSYNINTNNWYNIITHSVTVPHNADGTKSIGISLYMNGKLSNWYPNGTVSRKITLPTIPRTSSFSINPTTVELGKPITISINRASSSFTHTLQYNFSTSGWTTFASGVGTSSSFTPPSSWVNLITTSDRSWGRIKCITYSGGTWIGEKEIRFDVTVPSNVVPSISGITVVDTVETVKTKFGMFVQGKSIPKVTISASGVSGSKIIAYSTSVNGTVYSGSSFTTGVVNSSGTLTISSTVTDSRGRTAKKETTISVQSYASPTLNTFKVERCNSTGSPDINGTYVKITINGKITSLSSKNDKTCKVEYKPSTSETWTTLFTDTSTYDINSSQVKTITGGFLITSRYDFKVTIKDFFTDTSSSTVIPTTFTLMNINPSGKGIAFGKVSEKDQLEVALAAEFLSTLTVKGMELSTLIVCSPTEPTNQTPGSLWLREV